MDGFEINTDYLQTLADPCAGMSFTEKRAAISYISEQVSSCSKCDELATTRKNTVVGEGHLEPKVCIIGEAPGADEDRQGRPFVGRAGQLLDRILAACNFKREEVYITNILKCRPPFNRNPLPVEISNCMPYLRNQLSVLKPQTICALGAFSAQSLLQTDTRIGLLRGRWHEYEGIPLLCTYHPAYLLRNPAKKRDVWEDMKMLIARLAE